MYNSHIITNEESPVKIFAFKEQYYLSFFAYWLIIIHNIRYCMI